MSALISDIMMPGQSGIELVRQVLQRHPQLHTVLMSGYAENLSQIPEGTRFLPKPFAPQGLLDAVTRRDAEPPNGATASDGAESDAVSEPTPPLADPDET